MPLYLWDATFGEKIVSEVFIKRYYELFDNGYCPRVKTCPKYFHKIYILRFYFQYLIMQRQFLICILRSERTLLQSIPQP